MNIGLITPETIVERVLSYSDKNNIKINSLEGFSKTDNWLERVHERNLYKLFRKDAKENFLTIKIPLLNHGLKEILD